MTHERLMDYFNAVFPKGKNAPEPKNWQLLQEVFEAQPDIQIPGVRGTLWGAYNSITRFEDYKNNKKDEQPDQRLERIWFGSGADLKLKALDKAIDLSVNWN